MDYLTSYDPDEEFLRLVATGAIERFGHREHLRLALLSARASTTADDVTARCRAGIRAVASAKGAPGMYHETITAAWAAIMLDAAGALPEASFEELLARRPALAEPGYLARFYSAELLASERARVARLAPDRAALPELRGGARC